MASTQVDLRTAVTAAHSYFQSIQDLMSDSAQDLRLEEVELSEDKQFWLITLGFSRPVSPSDRSPLEVALFTKPRREYKVFKVDAETGEVQSMKIREL